MSEKVDAYTIFDISKWQIELEEMSSKTNETRSNRIELPTLQRGFVWKTYQMEALWDSILRGYPIGSLLMSKSKLGPRFLLDGQQRCTTIALGFQDPLSPLISGLINIKKENIPTIWIDLKPLGKNKYGLRFAIRVLTRSHPWGYSLYDHQKRLTTSEQSKALESFRKRSGNSTLSFSKIEPDQRYPWDAHFPVPLSLILTTNKKDLKAKITNQLKHIITKHGGCNYDQIDDKWLEELYRGVEYAKSLLLPEIVFKKQSLEADDDNNDVGRNEQDATLFFRLNSSGTTISGAELIYSLLKASFPKAKELVEEIGLNYLAPSTVVNIFVRFIKMKRNHFNSFERQISLTEFRSLLKEGGFEQELKNYIDNKDAKKLMDRAISIINDHPSHLPSILKKEMVSRNIDLMLVLMVYLNNNKVLLGINNNEIRKSFIHSSLFSKSKEKKKFIPKFYGLLRENNWKHWGDNWDRCSKDRHDLLPPLLPPKEFSEVLKSINENYFEHKNSHFSSEELIKDIFRENEVLIKQNIIKPISDINLDKEVFKEKQVEHYTKYWIRLSNFVFWNKQFLILAQREYFNSQFDDFMAFDGIEDTNRPWDWDHIYPNSWIYRKGDISNLVRWLKDSNGNYRALSFNENRSQSNNQSPEKRFNNELEIQKNSFVCPNDLSFWMNLTNSDNRLTKENSKVSDFVNAVFTRIDNIYQDCYSVINEIDKKGLEK